MAVPIPGRPLATQSPPTPGDWPKYGMAMRFKVTIEHASAAGISDLGMWSGCKGLKVTFATTPVKMGGVYAYERLLPDTIKYQNVTLERGVNYSDSSNVQSWLASVAKNWQDSTYQRASMSITMYDATGGSAMVWTLRDVIPVSWSGPSLSATDNKVAIETLELAHQGFLATV
jgi:phage tail-like protein